MVKLKKGSAAAKAWGAKMKRLRNKAVTRSTTKRKRTGGVQMARKRRRRTTRSYAKSYSRKGKNIMNSGLFNVTGILGNAIKGAGAAAIAEKFLPQVIPYQNAAVGFAVGGVGGAGGALLKDLIGGFSSTGTGTPLNY